MIGMDRYLVTLGQPFRAEQTYVRCGSYASEARALRRARVVASAIEAGYVYVGEGVYIRALIIVRIGDRPGHHDTYMGGEAIRAAFAREAFDVTRPDPDGQSPSTRSTATIDSADGSRS